MDELTKQSKAQEEVLEQAQVILRRMSFTASDDEEKVTVRVSGDGRVRNIEINQALDNCQPEELAESVVEAVNNALSQARDGAIERLADRGAELAGAGDLLARQRS